MDDGGARLERGVRAARQGGQEEHEQQEERKGCDGEGEKDKREAGGGSNKEKYTGDLLGQLVHRPAGVASGRNPARVLSFPLAHCWTVLTRFLCYLTWVEVENVFSLKPRI